MRTVLCCVDWQTKNDYINQLESGQAGRITPDEGETTAVIRRRLGAAAELLGKSLVMNRLGDVVYFWEEG